MSDMQLKVEEESDFTMLYPPLNIFSTKPKCRKLQNTALQLSLQSFFAALEINDPIKYQDLTCHPSFTFQSRL